MKWMVRRNMYAEFSQKTKSKQNKGYNLFFCLYLNLVCCSHFRIVLPWPQLSVCMRLDKNRSRLSMSAYMQKQSNHNFELIDKASLVASTLFLSLSLSLRLPIKISPFYRVAFQVNANFITHSRMWTIHTYRLLNNISWQNLRFSL